MQAQNPAYTGRPECYHNNISKPYAMDAMNERDLQDPQQQWPRFIQPLVTWCTHPARPSLRSRVRLIKRNGNRVEKDTIGSWGEHLAVLWLRRHGRKVLYRNFRAPGGGEVDIIARHDKFLTFVEVKTRTSTAWGRPADAVGAEKQSLILRGAKAWLRLLDNAQAIPTRCDIIEVVLQEGHQPEITVIEGAFREERI